MACTIMLACQNESDEALVTDVSLVTDESSFTESELSTLTLTEIEENMEVIAVLSDEGLEIASPVYE